jgi:sulfatase maturation enzyme AslB (radical SAM superfamily)
MDEWSPKVRHIEYMGGEPLIQNEFLKLTDKLIEGGFSKQIQLSLSTNAAIDGTDIVNRLCANFEKVSINLSIDGVKERFEYLRHGAKWNEVSGHLLGYYLLSKKNSNLSLGITHTVSWLNTYYVPEIFEMVNSLAPGLQIHLNLVFNPDYLNCSVLPTEVKSKILGHLKKYTNQNSRSEKAIRTLTQHLENAYPHRILFEEGILINKDADKYRNESYAETFPEFYALIERYYSKAKPRRWSFKILNNFFNRWGIFDFIYD